MGWANKLIGWATGNGAEVDSTNRLLVNLAQGSSAPTQVGSVRMFSEVDPGNAITGVTVTPWLFSPETDDDYRLRIGQDCLFDNEVFVYTAQNTGKHIVTFTTMQPAWTVNGMQTNSTTITTTTTGATGGTFAYFPVHQLVSMTYVETKLSFTSAPVANTIIDFGLFLRGASTAYAPTDGVYFRLTSSGMVGVVNYNGTEVQTGVFTAAGSAAAWTYVVNQKYDYIITIHEGGAEFWINNVLYGTVNTETSANAFPCMAVALPWSFRHAIVGGAAGGAMTALISAYNVSLGGPNFSRSIREYVSASYGTYQGLSGGTLGSLATYAAGANPTAAVPTNTSLTANLLAGLGGQVWETGTAALTLDGIVMQYLVPAGTANILGKRLFINGISLSSYIQTVLAGGPMNIQWALFFGNNTANPTTAESASGTSATVKAPRKIALPQFTQTVTAAQAVNTVVAQVAPYIAFTNPIIVNPGEYVQLSCKKVGTVLTGGVFGHQIAFDYSWE